MVEDAPDVISDVASAAYRRFRDLILLGEYAPGAPFPVVTLADATGFGRTPAREAARRLEQEGLLIRVAGQRPVVAPLDSARIASWYALRMLIECTGLQVTLPGLQGSDWLRLEELLEEMRAAAATQDLDAWEGPHREFHRVLIRGLSRHLRAEAESLSERTEWARRVRLLTGQRWQSAMEEHEVILEVARRRQIRQAQACLVEHYSRTVDSILGESAEHGDVSAAKELLSLPDPHACGFPRPVS